MTGTRMAILVTGRIGQTYLVFFLHLIPQIFGFDRCNLCMITKKRKYKQGVQVCVELRGCLKKLIEQMLHKEGFRVLDVGSDQAGVGKGSLISLHIQLIQTVPLTSCVTE